MQSSIRVTILSFVLLVMTVAPTLNVQSQDAFDCSMLSAAACKSLQASDANLAKELSGQFTIALSYNFTVGSSTGTFNNGTYNVTGNGSFSRDLLPTDKPFDIQAFLNSLGLNLQSILYQTAFVNGTSHQNQVAAAIVIAGGQVYNRVSKTPLVWQGHKVSDWITDIANTFNRSIQNSPNALTAKVLNDPDVIAAVKNIPSIKNVVTISTTGYTPFLDGQLHTEFLYTYDIPTLLKARQMYAFYRALLKTTTPGAVFTDQQLAQIANEFNLILKGSTFKITRWIGNKDNFTRSLAVDLVFKEDTSVMGQLAPVQENVSAKLHFEVKITGLNKPVTVTPPPNAVILPTYTPTASSTPTPTEAGTPVNQ